MLLSKNAKERLTAWWEHRDMDRPCFNLSVSDGTTEPEEEVGVERYWTDVDGMIRRMMRRIDHTRYLCEAVPAHYVDFGSTPLAACLGGELELRDKVTTWNIPFLEVTEDPEDFTFRLPLERILSLKLDEDNRWWRLIKEATKRSAALGHDHHYTAYPSLSGGMDILAALIGGESLMYVLEDDPESVIEAQKHILNLWEKAFRQLGAIIDTAGNDGYVGGWPGVWSPGRSYPLQEDFSCMISPDAFEELCIPFIDARARMMEWGYYHLDGPDAARKCRQALCGLSSIQVIQWETGAGNERIDQWYDLIRSILAAGKSMHVSVFSKVEKAAGRTLNQAVDSLIREVGAKGLLINVICDSDEEAYRFMEAHKLDEGEWRINI